MERRFYHVAHELDIDVLILIKLAKRHGIKYNPSEEEIDFLKRKISGFYDLNDGEIRTLEKFLNSEESKVILEEAIPLAEKMSEEQERKYLIYISKRLFESMKDSSFKNKIRPETIYETISNLGVVEQYRCSGRAREKKDLPVHLLKFDKDIAMGILKRHFIGILEKVVVNSSEDFDRANKVITEEYRRLRDYV